MGLVNVDDMNNAQARAVRFIGTGAAAGIGAGMLFGLILPTVGVGPAEQIVLFAVFGMMLGLFAAWFSGLR